VIVIAGQANQTCGRILSSARRWVKRPRPRNAADAPADGDRLTTAPTAESRSGDFGAIPWSLDGEVCRHRDPGAY